MNADDPRPEDPIEAMTADLHALADGQLPPDRVEAVLTHLRAQPADAVRLAEWQAQRLALRHWHRGLQLDAMPPAMAKVLQAAPAPSQPRRAIWAAAAALLLAVSTGLGGLWWGARSTGGVSMGDIAQARNPQGFVREATVAHAVYTPESRHPVEVGAAEEAHLVAWLSRRLGSPLKAPSLQTQGFRLLGGRLLPGEKAPRAQFMYEDSRGRRVTLYVTTFGPDEKARPKEISFRSFTDGPIESFYWIEGPYGYALSAQLPPSDVMALSREVYRQLSP